MRLTRRAQYLAVPGTSLLLGLAGCVGEPVQPDAAAASTVLAPPVPVTVATVRRQDLSDQVTATGAVAAARRLRVAPEIAGRLADLEVREGDSVTAGQVLARLDDHDALLHVLAAQASLDTARSQAQSAGMDVTIAGGAADLAKTSAEQELREAQARLAQAQGEVAVTKGKETGALSAAEAELIAAQARTSAAQSVLDSAVADETSAEAGVDAAKAGTQSGKESLNILEASTQERERIQAESDVTKANSDMEVAAKTLERMQHLVRRGAAPEQDVDIAQNQLVAAQGQLAMAQKNLDTLNAKQQGEDNQAQDQVTVGVAEEAKAVAAVDQSKAAVAQAQAGLVLAKAEETAAAADLRALQNGSELGQRQLDVQVAQAEVAVAQGKLLDTADDAARLRKAQIDQGAAVSAVSLANANLQVANAAEGQTSLRSPISGIVASRSAEPGETLEPGQVVLEVYDPASFYLEATVSASDAAEIHAGQAAHITLEAAGRQTAEGTVTQILPPTSALDSFRVKIAFSQPGPGLTLGLVGTAVVESGRRVDVLTVRRSALLDDDANASSGEVYVVDASHIVHGRKVSVGERSGDLVEVTAGLKEGDRVVVDGQELLRDGSAVAPK